MGSINVAGLDPAEILAALYNRSQPLGLGFLQYRSGDMSAEEARSLLSEGRKRDNGGVYFDYLKGRVMKVNVGGDEVDPGLYDRDNGQGACAAAIEFVRQKSAAQ